MQTEDEIAAITMAVGGALTGTRASTSTSGPGFSLMARAWDGPGSTRSPSSSRSTRGAAPAPACPTRHEQGDLRFALHAGHGDFPRIVLASGDLEETFYDVTRAFNYAEKYQLPVIHIVDKAMANSDHDLQDIRPVPRQDREGGADQGRQCPGHERRVLRQIQADHVGRLAAGP